MPYKSKIQKNEYQKKLMREKRTKLYKLQDTLTVVSPEYKIYNCDNTESIFTFTPIILTKKDELTLQKLIMNKFIQKNQINYLNTNQDVSIMEQIFVSSVITKDLMTQQQTLASQHIKNKREYRRQKLRASKIRTGWIVENKITI